MASEARLMLSEIHQKTGADFLANTPMTKYFADEAPAAFYDFRSAMGGEGSMARFLGMGLTQGDGIHFNAKGGAFVADRLVASLGRAFATWTETHPRAGCD